MSHVNELCILFQSRVSSKIGLFAIIVWGWLQICCNPYLDILRTVARVTSSHPPLIILFSYILVAKVCYCEQYIDQELFWNMMPCSLVEVYRRFGRINCLHLYGRRIVPADVRTGPVSMSMCFDYFSWSLPHCTSRLCVLCLKAARLNELPRIVLAMQVSSVDNAWSGDWRNHKRMKHTAVHYNASL
jgi:hypothetical protein